MEKLDITKLNKISTAKMIFNRLKSPFKTYESEGFLLALFTYLKIFGMILELVKSKSMDKDDYKELYSVVENTIIRQGISSKKYLLDFLKGLKLKYKNVGVTEGIVGPGEVLSIIVILASLSFNLYNLYKANKGYKESDKLLKDYRLDFIRILKNIFNGTLTDERVLAQKFNVIYKDLISRNLELADVLPNKNIFFYKDDAILFNKYRIASFKDIPDIKENSRLDLRNWLIENVEIDEGIIKALGSTIAAPVKLAGTAVKTAGSAITAPIKVAGGAVKTAAKTAGNLITLKPGQAAKSLGTGVSNMGKSAIKPVSTVVKGTQSAIAKPLQHLGGK